MHQLIEHPHIAATLCRKEPPAFEDKVALQFWIIAQMRVREFEWLRYQSGTLDEVSWSTYRDVIPFVLGTERARALWRLCRPFFDRDFVAMVDDTLETRPYVDFWQKVDAVS